MNSPIVRSPIVFDLDGTLIDSLRASGRYILESLTAVDGKRMTVEEIYQYFGRPEEMIFNMLCRQESAALAAECYYELVRANFTDFPVFSGIVDLLDRLHENGFRLALYTARGFHATHILLKEHGLEKYFESVVTGSEVSKMKPHPEGLEAIARYFKVPVTAILYVGDSLSDLEMARQAACTPVHVAWTSISIEPGVVLGSGPENCCHKYGTRSHFTTPAELQAFLLNKL